MASPTPFSEMTILELTQLVLAQDTRWADILTRAQSTHHPLATGGLAFFRRTWRPAMTSYLEDFAAKRDSAARVPPQALSWLLDLMSKRIYPAARAVGFTDHTFLFPDVVLEQSGHPSTIAGADPQPGRINVGTLAVAAAAFVGLGYLASRPRRRGRR